jgi:hypothetical protein
MAKWLLEGPHPPTPSPRIWERGSCAATDASLPVVIPMPAAVPGLKRVSVFGDVSWVVPGGLFDGPHPPAPLPKFGEGELCGDGCVTSCCNSRARCCTGLKVSIRFGDVSWVAPGGLLDGPHPLVPSPRIWERGSCAVTGVRAFHGMTTSSSVNLTFHEVL